VDGPSLPGGRFGRRSPILVPTGAVRVGGHCFGGHAGCARSDWGPDPGADAAGLGDRAAGDADCGELCRRPKHRAQPAEGRGDAARDQPERPCRVSALRHSGGAGVAFLGESAGSQDRALRDGLARLPRGHVFIAGGQRLACVLHKLGVRRNEEKKAALDRGRGCVDPGIFLVKPTGENRDPGKVRNKIRTLVHGSHGRPKASPSWHRDGPPSV